MLKSAGDETLVDFFRKICVRVKEFFPEDLKDDAIRLGALQSWLEEELGEELLGFERGENLREQLVHELGIVEELKPGVEERGSMEERG